MTTEDDLATLRQAIEYFSDCHQELDDRACLALLRRLGQPGLEYVAELLRSQVDAAVETLACYCAELIVRSGIPGNLDLTLEVLDLPFSHFMVRHEVWESIFDWAVGFPEFRADKRFIAKARAIASQWTNGQLTQFLERAER